MTLKNINSKFERTQKALYRRMWLFVGMCIGSIICIPFMDNPQISFIPFLLAIVFALYARYIQLRMINNNTRAGQGKSIKHVKYI